MELLTAIQTGLLVTAVIGATEAVNRAFNKEWKAVTIIVVASLLGGVGAVLLAGLSAAVFLAGVGIGLGASGIITTVQKVGQKA